MPGRLLIAPDKFKGTLRASEVAAAVGRGVERGGGEPPDLCPLADGGDGTAEVLLLALGGESAGADAHDALGRPIRAGFALLGDGATAVVEVAEASGLRHVAEHERDPEAASTAGTGELIAAAVAAGAETVLVAAGGSATTDGGEGCLRALEEGGGLGPARLVVLCDVRTPYELAAERFAPQKGADPAAVRRLTARLHERAAALPRDPRGHPSTGAAGGLSGALWAAHGARLVGGAAFVLDALDYDERMRSCAAVVVGEGRLDATTLEGKAPAEAATRARQAGVPCHAVTGSDALSDFDKRILDLQHVLEAPTLAALEQAGVALARCS